MRSPPSRTSFALVLSAAGFIATRTSGWSPAVSIAVEPKLIWKAETPNVVPCGARISAGKSGKVARSLPASAVESVNCPPVSCMPSPESPAKRTTTASCGGRAVASFSVRRWVAVATGESLQQTCEIAALLGLCALSRHRLRDGNAKTRLPVNPAEDDDGDRVSQGDAGSDGADPV